MTDTIITLIDAIADDLRVNAAGIGLPQQYNEIRYSKPLLENVSQCPLLAIYPFGSEPSNFTTDGQFIVPDTLVVGWFEAVPDSMDTGTIDNSIAQASLARAGSLNKHIRGYYSTIPNVPFQTNVSFGRVRYGRVRGGILGVEIHVIVTTWQGT